MCFRQENTDFMVAQTIQNAIKLQQEKEQKSRPIFTSLLEDIFIERSKSTTEAPSKVVQELPLKRKTSVWEEKPVCNGDVPMEISNAEICTSNTASQSYKSSKTFSAVIVSGNNAKPPSSLDCQSVA